jgi:DNA invertase Pin-like site-specific DNA recombinase
MRVGYARTSTVEQVAGFDAQLDELQRAGCEKVFREQVSSVAPRAQLEAALDFIRERDLVVVSKLDRLARSTQHLLEIADRVNAKGANLQVLNLGIDTGTATGKLLLTMIGAIAQFERENMLERQREGIAKAKMEGKYKGRAPTARAKTAEARALRAEGLGRRRLTRGWVSAGHQCTECWQTSGEHVRLTMIVGAPERVVNDQKGKTNLRCHQLRQLIKGLVLSVNYAL